MDMRLPPEVLRSAESDSVLAALPPFSHAFQPIVDVDARCIHSYEALIRGPRGEPGATVMQMVPAARRFEFDQASRAAAIAFAARKGFAGRLNLNFFPQSPSVSARSIRHTAQAATRNGVALERILLEFPRDSAVPNPEELAALLNEYRGLGMMLAIDDYAGGASGRAALERFQPDVVKLEVALVRGIAAADARCRAVGEIMRECALLGIEVVAKAVESREEYDCLAHEGLHLFQGSLFAAPQFEAFAAARLP